MRRQCHLYIIAIWLLLAFRSEAQTPYLLAFPTLDGTSISLERYSNKKLLVVICDAAAPDSRQLRMIDSLYRADSAALSVIAVPANDFGDPLDSTTLIHLLKDSLGLHYPVAQTGKASKTSEGDQHPLLSWLTHVESNQHFDKDITEAGRIYLISEEGSLYGLFQKTISPIELSDAIHQTITP